MKLLLALVIVIAIAGFLGWISFKDSGDATTIQIDKKQIKEDTSKAIEKSREAVDRAVERGREGLEKIKQ